MPAAPKSDDDRDSNGVSSTSRSLLVRVRENDSDAWNRLVTLYTPLVCFWCHKLGLSDQDIPDVVQDVFRTVTSGIERFRNDRPQDTFRGWLRTITRSRVTDHYRRRQRQPDAVGCSDARRLMAEFADNIDDESVDEPVYNDLFLRALELIRQDFREHTWKAFWRVVVDGMTPGEVAEELSMKPGSVRVAKSRVLQRLRQELGEIPE